MKFVIKFVSKLRQVGSFLRVIRFLQPINLTLTILLYYSLDTLLIERDFQEGVYGLLLDTC